MILDEPLSDRVLIALPSTGFGDLGDGSAGRCDGIKSFASDCYRVQSCRASVAAGACYPTTSTYTSCWKTRLSSNRP